MKCLLLGLLLGLNMNLAQAIDAYKVVENLTWDSPSAQKVPNGKITNANGVAVLTISLKVTPGEKDPDSVTTLFRLTNPPLTSTSYAITGQVACQNVGLATLAMIVTYEGSAPMEIETNEKGGLQKPLSGTSDFRPFALPFYRPGFSGKLQQLEIQLRTKHPMSAAEDHAGPGAKISLRNLKLMEFPKPPPPPPPLPPRPITVVPPAPPNQLAQDGHNVFWAIVIAVIIGLLILGGSLLFRSPSPESKSGEPKSDEPQPPAPR